jgi:hypothetical protein
MRPRCGLGTTHAKRRDDLLDPAIPQPPPDLGAPHPLGSNDFVPRKSPPRVGPGRTRLGAGARRRGLEILRLHAIPLLGGDHPPRPRDERPVTRGIDRDQLRPVLFSDLGDAEVLPPLSRIDDRSADEGIVRVDEPKLCARLFVRGDLREARGIDLPIRKDPLGPPREEHDAIDPEALGQSGQRRADVARTDADREVRGRERRRRDRRSGFRQRRLAKDRRRLRRRGHGRDRRGLRRRSGRLGPSDRWRRRLEPSGRRRWRLGLSRNGDRWRRRWALWRSRRQTARLGVDRPPGDRAHELIERPHAGADRAILQLVSELPRHLPRRSRVQGSSEPFERSPSAIFDAHFE